MRPTSPVALRRRRAFSLDPGGTVISVDWTHGRFVWHELLTDEPDEAARFYREVMGWRMEAKEESAPPYRMFTSGESPVAGLVERTDDAPDDPPPRWLGYVATRDADATLARAREMGARKLTVREVPGIGRFALFHDPQGAVAGACTLETPPATPDGKPGVGRFTWHELATTDLGAAFDAYVELFGWDEAGAFDLGEMGPYRMFGARGVQLGGMYRTPAGGDASPAWLHYARVGDLDGALERVRGGGGGVIDGPMEVPGGDLVARCTDPGGARFALHQVVGAAG